MIGHSVACLGFFAHELSHNTIFKNPLIRYFFEIICWGLNLVPPTVWHRVHNHTHHIHANTTVDPDRQFLTSEACPTTAWYSRIFYPNNESSSLNFCVFFHFVPYILRNTIAVFYPDQTRPTLVPAKPVYTRRERFTVTLELIAIMTLQWVIFDFVGGDFERFVFASPVAVLITSSIVMSYIFTNHFLNPLSDSSDPLTNTTSIVVYRIFDRLHLNFSYHTEHHLFPGMNSDYYPKVSQLLRTVTALVITVSVLGMRGISYGKSAFTRLLRSNQIGTQLRQLIAVDSRNTHNVIETNLADLEPWFLRGINVGRICLFLLPCSFHFRPRIAQHGCSIENERVWCGIFAVDAKIAEPLKLESFAGLCVREIGLDPTECQAF